MKAIQITEFGGPEVLTLNEMDIGSPDSGFILVRNHSIGVNYADIIQRQGLRLGRYPVALPLVPGAEAAGVVEAIGDNVNDFKVGDRVAFLSVGTVLPGSYAEKCLVPAKDAVLLPDHMSFEQGASLLGQGLTAQYLIREFRQIKAGDTVLVHSAAGGVGLLLVQWARHLGAHVIGTVSSLSKAEAVFEAGAQDVINYVEQDFVTEVERITGGEGADFILDGIGKTTFPGDLKAAAIRGHIVLYGVSSGLVDPISPNIFRLRSLTVSGSNVLNFTRTREEMVRRANDVISGVQQGWLNLRIHDIHPLEQASEAHRQIESRMSMGKVLLSV